MKKSNIILGSAFSFLLALVIAFVVIMRIMLGGQESEARPYDYSGWTSRDYSLAGFTGVSVDGPWEIKLERSGEFKVTVEAPAEIRDEITVHQSRGMVRLAGVRGGSKSIRRRLKAEIRMPQLASLQVAGLVNLELQNFNAEHLEIVMSGANKITGSGNEIGNLRLALDGISTIKLRGNPVTSADVNLAGAYSLEMTFSGGELKGSAAGVGKLYYDGVVDRGRLITTGVLIFSPYPL